MEVREAGEREDARKHKTTSGVNVALWNVAFQ
jgi:hypothetical protein